MNKEKTPVSTHAEGIITTTGKGLGFVSLGKESPRENDIRIEAGLLNTALPGDHVKVALHSRVPNMQQTGEVVEILDRARTRYVGTIDQNGTTYLVPQDNRIYVDFLIPTPPTENLSKKKVLVELLEWTDPKKNPTAKIIEVIGNVGENETEIRAIVLEKGLALELPEEIEKEAHALKASAPAFIAEEAKKRRDFRSITTFTIDPADAKDFDDAISVQTLPSGDIEIGVHIADVSAYVKPHTAIDEEARSRATSIYLVDRVIPMFPEVLSNDLCSLNQKEDKLVFSAVFTFDAEAFSNPKAKAVVKDSWFGRTIINSDKRFTYEEAQEILDKGTGLFHEELLTLNTLAKKLAKQGKEEGAISFEHEEVRFVLDENKKPIRVYKKVMQDTNKLVEQFMLLANKKVAEYNLHSPLYAERKNNGFTIGAAAASVVWIKENKLLYGVLDDCFISVFGDDLVDHPMLKSYVEMSAKYLDGNFDWGKIGTRRHWRENIRNHKVVIEGKEYGYGVIDGREGFDQYLQTGEVALNKGDLVCVYTDGFIKMFQDREFAKELKEKPFTAETYKFISETAIKLEQYKEKTGYFIKND